MKPKLISKNYRVPCLGGCGQMVKRDAMECRKCRRARLHAGLKKIKPTEKKTHLAPNFETSKEKYDRVKKG
jgi:hypothetical protein